MFCLYWSEICKRPSRLMNTGADKAPAGGRRDRDGQRKHAIGWRGGMLLREKRREFVGLACSGRQAEPLETDLCKLREGIKHLGDRAVVRKFGVQQVV